VGGGFDTPFHESEKSVGGPPPPPPPPPGLETGFREAACDTDRD
jgi:hypothetical protein